MNRLTIIMLLLCAIVAACKPPAIEPIATTPSLPTGVPLPTDTPAEVTADAPTPIPLQEITICQADEPNTLFVYGGPSRTARNVLETLYDGPVDIRGYQFYPIILDSLPTVDNGDVTIGEVSVSAGSTVVNADGAVVNLGAGATVVDASANQVEYNDEPLNMAQMIVTFTLRADVTWADGQPVTADDSHFSYELAGQIHNPVLERMRRYTQDYVVVDNTTVVWKGVPGYHEPFYHLYFYQPLHRHALGTTDPDQLLSAEVTQRNPLGWGAFVVEEWVDGQYLTLVRNPHYFRAPEGLPYLDRITFRTVPNLQQALNDLLSGTCDLITQDIIERRVIENGDLAPLLEAADAGKVQLIQSPSSEWEHLDFGITPAEWIRRPDFFGDVRVRHAVAMCIHRERIAGEAVPFGEASLASSYVATEHPLYAGDELYRWDYNPSEALALLDDVGWRDEDGDGIREAHSVAGIDNGTPFSVTLLTNTGNLAHERTARILQENFSACGIGLSVEYMPDWEFFADGPNGLVFGRQFDLALFSWLNDFQAQCGLYLSEAIPSASNLWATTNNPGYASDEYDAACHAALKATYGTSAYESYHREAQRIFSYDLPVVPLYFVPQLVAVRPGISGVQLDPSQHLELWNVEMFEVLSQSE